MPPTLMTPAAVAAFMQLREELTAEYARLRGRLGRRRRPAVAAAPPSLSPPAVTLTDRGPFPMPHRSVRRAA